MPTLLHRLSSSKKTSLVLRSILCFIVLVSLGNLLKILTNTNWPDFTSYYYTVSLYFQEQNPYLPSHLTPSGPFIYPPFALLLFLPFHFLSYISAGIVFTCISLICFGISLWLLYRLLAIQFLSIIGLIITILLCNFFPLKYTLGMGQFNTVILLLLVLFLYGYHKKSELLSGVSLSYALALKLFPIVWLGFLLIERRFKLLGIIGLVGLLSIFIGYSIFGPEVTRYFFSVTAPDLVKAHSSAYYNQSITGFLGRLPLNDSVSYILRMSSLLGMLAISLLTIYKKRNIPLLSLSLLLTVNLISNGISWQHHMVWMIIPLLVSYAYIRDKQLSVWYYLALFIAYLLIGINLRNPASLPVLLQSHGFYGLCLLFVLQIRLLTVPTKNTLKKKTL